MNEDQKSIGRGGIGKEDEMVEERDWEEEKRVEDKYPDGI